MWAGKLGLTQWSESLWPLRFGLTVSAPSGSILGKQSLKPYPIPSLWGISFYQGLHLKLGDDKLGQTVNCSRT